MSAEKRKCDAMDTDESEAQPTKKQCTVEDAVEAQFEDALESIRKQAAIDRSKLVKAACKHFVDRNGVVPTEEQLVNVFAALSAKFAPIERDSDDIEDEDSGSGDDDAPSAVPPNFANALTTAVQTQMNDALDVATSLGKASRKKLEGRVKALWNQEHNADPTSEETEAVFAVMNAWMWSTTRFITPGDDDAEDEDYAPTEKDMDEEVKDAEVDASEADEVPLKKVTVCLAANAEVADEDDGDDAEDEAIEFTTEVEVTEKDVEKLKAQFTASKGREPTKEELESIFTSKISDAEFDEKNDEDYKPTEQEKAEEAADVDDDHEEDVDEKPKEYNEEDDKDYKPADDAAGEEEEQEKDEEFGEADKVEPADDQMEDIALAA